MIDDRQIMLGRRIVLSVVVITFFLILAMDIVPGLVREPRGPLHLPRVLITAVLAFFLLRRAKWARWAGAVFYVLMGLGAIVLGNDILSANRSDPFIIALGERIGLSPGKLFFIGLAYGASAAVLIFHPAVRAYFRPRI